MKKHVFFYTILIVILASCNKVELPREAKFIMNGGMMLKLPFQIEEIKGVYSETYVFHKNGTFHMVSIFVKDILNPKYSIDKGGYFHYDYENSILVLENYKFKNFKFKEGEKNPGRAIKNHIIANKLSKTDESKAKIVDKHGIKCLEINGLFYHSITALREVVKKIEKEMLNELTDQINKLKSTITQSK